MTRTIRPFVKGVAALAVLFLLGTSTVPVSASQTSSRPSAVTVGASE